MAKKHSIVAGLDIGTSKVCTVVGEMTDQGVEIIGLGTHPSQGLRKGVVINIESTVAAIKKAVEEAELMAGCEIHTVFTGIAGGHIKGFNSHGIVAVKNKEVGARDLDRVLDAAKAVAIPQDQEVLHVLPRVCHRRPGRHQATVGYVGRARRSARALVTGAVTATQNVVKCCNRAGLTVAEIVFMPLTAAECCSRGRRPA
jgi:cell division protein FtsA